MKNKYKNLSDKWRKLDWWDNIKLLSHTLLILFLILVSYNLFTTSLYITLAGGLRGGIRNFFTTYSFPITFLVMFIIIIVSSYAKIILLLNSDSVLKTAIGGSEAQE